VKAMVYLVVSIVVVNISKISLIVVNLSMVSILVLQLVY
jgi:hypothetical protein